jgi:hypothetical protein
MSPEPPPPRSEAGGSEGPAGRVVVGAVVVYAIALAVATVSETFGLGWFDWMILSR